MYPTPETKTLQAADPPQHVPVTAPPVMLKHWDPEAIQAAAVVVAAAVVAAAVVAATVVAAAAVVAEEEMQAFVT